jgi:hypothetical protein
MFLLAQMVAGAWGIGHIAIAVVVAVILIGIVIIVVRVAGVPIPSWFWQIIGLVVLGVVAIIAIKFVMSM